MLVQSNYGGRLTIAGVPVWRELTPQTAVDCGEPTNRNREPGPRTTNAEPEPTPTAPA